MPGLQKKGAFNKKLAYLDPSEEGGRGNIHLEEITYKANACYQHNILFSV